jgi:hypothetical protein
MKYTVSNKPILMPYTRCTFLYLYSSVETDAKQLEKQTPNIAEHMRKIRFEIQLPLYRVGFSLKSC